MRPGRVWRTRTGGSKRALRPSALCLAALAILGSSAQAQDAIELDGTSSMGVTEVPFDSGTGVWDLHDGLAEFSDGRTSLTYSLLRFNVPSGQTAQFSSSESLLQRIFARVTGGDISDISGTIRSLPSADLYLINPAGVSFNSVPSIDVNGAFFATGASELGFANGETLIAEAGAIPTTIDADPTRFGFHGEGAGLIELNDLDGPITLDSGETFALIGKDVTVLDSGTTQPSIIGDDETDVRIILVAAGDGVDVPMDVVSWDPSSVDPTIALGAVTLDGARLSNPVGTIIVRGGRFVMRNDANIAIRNNLGVTPSYARAVDVTTRDAIQLTGSGTSIAARDDSNGSGSIRLESSLIEVDGAILSGVTLSSVDGPEIALIADDLVLRDALLSSQSASMADAGRIHLEGAQTQIDAGTTIRSIAIRDGQSGEINLIADSLAVAEGSTVYTETRGAGDGTDVQVDTRTLELRDGSSIRAEATAGGDSGNIDIRAQQVAVLDGSSIRTRTGADGNSRNVSIIAPPGTGSVLVTNGSEIGSVTEGTGNAGNLLIELDGPLVADGGEAGVASLGSRAIVSASEPLGANTIRGDAGTATVDVSSLTLRNGANITVSNSGQGLAGSIFVTANQVTLDGRTSAARSGLFAQLLGSSPGSGSGGVIDVTTEGDFEIRNGARMSVETQTELDAGDLSVSAGGYIVVANDASIVANSTSDGASGGITLSAGRGIILRDGAEIRARSTGSGRAGRVALFAGPFLEVRNSQISTEASAPVNAGGGEIELQAVDRIILTDSTVSTNVQAGDTNSGNIEIDPQLVVLNRSSVTANAFTGDGGRISIRAGAFVQSSGSTLEASSRNSALGGVDGVIIIQSPVSDLTGELAQPPQTYLDAATLMASACAAARSGDRSSFVVAPIGNLDQTPHGTLAGADWDDRWFDQSASLANADGPDQNNGTATRIDSIQLAHHDFVGTHEVTDGIGEGSR